MQEKHERRKKLPKRADKKNQETPYNASTYGITIDTTNVKTCQEIDNLKSH